MHVRIPLSFSSSRTAWDRPIVRAWQPDRPLPIRRGAIAERDDEIEDKACDSLAHMWQDRLRRIVRAVQVHADHHVPDGRRQAAQRAVRCIRSGRVNDDVDLPESLERRGPPAGCIATGSVASAACIATSRPSSASWSLSSFSRPSRRAEAITFAPSRANRSAVSRPMPLDAPITSTTLSLDIAMIVNSQLSEFFEADSLNDFFAGRGQNPDAPGV